MARLLSELFCQYWKDKHITKPVVILIGGYAGTGKSTLAAHLAKRLEYAQTIPTGIFRSIAQTQSDPKRNPALFLSTYDLNTLYGNTTEDIRRAYVEQCEPVTQIITSVINFLAVEKQHLVIEGNHILPWEAYEQAGCSVIEMYTYVRDKEQHRTMLGGPTHNRTLTDEQFTTGRAIHDILYAETLKHGKALFECSEMEQAEAYLQQRFSEIMQTEGVKADVKT